MADGAQDNKTEPATPRRRSEARKKGKVARSVEVESAVVLLATLVILWLTGPRIMEGMIALYRCHLGGLAHADFTVPSATALLTGTILGIMAPLAPALVGMAVVSAFSGYGQVGLQVSSEALSLDLEKCNPVAGAQKLFSARSVVQLLVAALKLTAILVVGYVTVRAYLPRVLALYQATPAGMSRTMTQATLDLGLRVAVLMVIIAAIDYAYQRWQYERDLRMTKQEMKEEQKLLEGNPEVEARIRRVQYALARSRMLKNVKKADVVVRNPTHYAVALKYDAAKAPAPIVLAKGADYLALRIVELARKHRVPTVRDAPLAQTLYKTVEVNQMIPPKLYRIVARLLVHIFKLRKRTPATGR